MIVHWTSTDCNKNKFNNFKLILDVAGIIWISIA